MIELKSEKNGELKSVWKTVLQMNEQEKHLLNKSGKLSKNWQKKQTFSRKVSEITKTVTK